MRILFLLHPFSSSPLERRVSSGHASSSGHSGGGGGGGSRSGSSSGARGGFGGSYGSHGSEVSTPHVMGGKSSASTYSNGGGKATKASSGAFKGSLLGGGTRSDIYGTRVYGSGYPKGYQSHDLPYYYYPVVWGAGAAAAGAATYPLYLNRTAEYGQPTNSSRPGGHLMQITLQSRLATNSSTFHFISDNTTVQAILPILRSYCSLYGWVDTNTSSSAPYAYTGVNASDPLPTDAVQYYRSSTAVLTLDGYNNTIVLSSTPNATAQPLPTNVDRVTLGCLNDTIGAAIPLINPPAGLSTGAIFGIVLGSLIGFFGCLLPCLIACVKCCCCCDIRRESRQERKWRKERERWEKAHPLPQYIAPPRPEVIRMETLPIPVATVNQNQDVPKVATVALSESDDEGHADLTSDTNRTPPSGSGGYAMIEGTCIMTMKHNRTII
ncbi:unnamed protein product [Peniophora sp. CBMAI 1063]|nr:unnamed protein product [Peniophora sp. CBMAI 1063]